jgi:phosphoribosyl-AMP cyclohydrolase
MTDKEPKPDLSLVEKMDWKKMDGMIPVVVQDTNTNALLMLAYANKLALEKTLSTGFAHYWSRSRNELWMKGATSGNTQKIKRVAADCDFDALLYVVEQKGPACHTGDYSCFHHDFEC